MNESVFSAINQQIVEKLPQGVVVVDSQGVCQWANQTLLALLGADASQLDDLSSTQRAQLEEWLSSIEIETSEGCALKKTCIELDDGGHAFLLERRQATERLTDPLTGLASQLSISIALGTLLSVARRYEKPLSVGMVRINNLDQLPRDQTLQAVSQCLKDELRWADLVGRNGDNSFIVVLPETDQHAADLLQEKLQQRLKQACHEADVTTAEYQIAISESNKRDDATGLLHRIETQLVA
ncbi:MAG: diguanylate cyclase [Gammaproteobacteria bacterium]|nr:diguanylate cyclase [Gammaproteobacteria bacterium]MCF6230746.1 diguanylate cyclase [Gammaproteobacteria bacterium]